MLPVCGSQMCGRITPCAAPAAPGTKKTRPSAISTAPENSPSPTSAVKAFSTTVTAGSSPPQRAIVACSCGCMRSRKGRRRNPPPGEQPLDGAQDHAAGGAVAEERHHHLRAGRIHAPHSSSAAPHPPPRPTTGRPAPARRSHPSPARRPMPSAARRIRLSSSPSCVTPDTPQMYSSPPAPAAGAAGPGPTSP